MAQQQAAQNHNQQHAHNSTSPQPHLTGLASNMRPHFFTKNAPLSGVLSGKSHSSAYPTPPVSPQMPHATLPASRTEASKVNPTPQQAMLATMAHQTLLGKLGGAFWDAFSGGSTQGPSSQRIDTDKVRRVLEGKAVVRVVDVDTLPPPSLNVPVPASLSRSPVMVAPSAADRVKCDPAMCMDKMEKMLGSLHL